MHQPLSRRYTEPWKTETGWPLDTQFATTVQLNVSVSHVRLKPTIITVGRCPLEELQARVPTGR